MSNLFINKDYHFNGSFEDGLKEKLLARYTVVFFPIQSDIFVLLQHEKGVDKTRHMKHSGTSRNIPEHEKNYYYFFMKK